LLPRIFTRLRHFNMSQDGLHRATTEPYINDNYHVPDGIKVGDFDNVEDFVLTHKISTKTVYAMCFTSVAFLLLIWFYVI